MSLSLYDVLDVAEDASPAEIRTAWKTAIADLDPGDRRFRMYNEAATVLLDPERRAEHDEQLSAARAEEEGEDPHADDRADDPAVGVEAVAPEPDVDADERTADEAPDDEATDDDAADDAGDDEAADDAGDDAADDDAADDEAEEESGASAGWAPLPGAVYGALGVLAVLALALAIWVATWPGTFGHPTVEERAAARTDGTSGVAAGEKIAQQVLSYGYRDLDQQLADAQALMTPAYGKEWAGVLKQLGPEVKAQKKTVTAAVRGSALADLSPDGSHADVLVLVDQLVQAGSTTQDELQMWATLRLIRDDGAWLLEKICTTDPDCAD